MPIDTSTPQKLLFMDWDDTVIHWGPFLRHPPSWILKAKQSIPFLNFLWDSLSFVWQKIREIGHRILPRPHDEPVEFFPGVLDFIREMKADGVKVVIVTNKEEGKFHRQLQHLTETHGLAGLFDSHVAHQRSFSHIHVRKPNPQIGVRALKTLGIEIKAGMAPLEIVHIGDRHNQDTKFAHRLDALLKQYNPDSSCKNILHNVYDWNHEYLQKLPVDETPHKVAQGYRQGFDVLPYKKNQHKTVREEVFESFRIPLPESRTAEGNMQHQDLAHSPTLPNSSRLLHERSLPSSQIPTR